MGRQAQLEIVQGALKRTLLRHFHNSPPFLFTFRAEHSCAGSPRAETAVATAPGLSSAKVVPHPPHPGTSVSSDTTAPRKLIPEPAFKQTSLFENDIPIGRPAYSARPETAKLRPLIDDCAIPEGAFLSETSLILRAAALARNISRLGTPLRPPSPANFLGRSSESILVAVSGTEFFTPSHPPGRVGQFSSRGYGSSAPSVNHAGEDEKKEKLENLRAPENRVGKRGHQGRDEEGLGARASSAEVGVRQRKAEQDVGASFAAENKPSNLNSSNFTSLELRGTTQSAVTNEKESHVASGSVLGCGGQAHDQAGERHATKEERASVSSVPHFTDQFTKEKLLLGVNLPSSAGNPSAMGADVRLKAYQRDGGLREGDGISPELAKRAAQPPSAKDTTDRVGVSLGGDGGRENDHASEFSNPKKLFAALLETKGGKGFQPNEKASLHSIFYRFAVSGWVSDQALSLYINSKFFPTAVSKFRRFFTHKASPSLRSFLLSQGGTNETVQMLFPLFAEFCVHNFSDEISRYRELVNTADMTRPHGWYPFARAIKRKIVYHKGPTNSGKTYNALQRFMASSSGIYCSPLRLLAMEVFDTVNMDGVYCNLHTGQERREVPFANHVSCTIEMCYLNQQWDVAVIDEIQMMSDEYRGWAWTRAFLGLQADEIHVCGDPSALQLVRNLCNQTGDNLVEFDYERFKPLHVAGEALRGDFRNVEGGDCIVAFSRRDIFDIKREVELTTKHRCCVVYGALPPETRTHQAKLFNQPQNEYSVLVASDAIGMGLNLNIRRVVFFSLDKFDGASKKPVAPAQVKQIAGRAGRRGSLYPQGETTTFFSQDLDYLRNSMLEEFHPSLAAGLFPVFEQVELFATQLPNENFAKLLERFAETCRLDGAFFLCRYDNLKRVANMLERVKGLSLEDRFNFCFAPVNVRDPQSMGALYRYATAFSQNIPVQVDMGVPLSSARDEFELLDLESRHQALSMYLWLSQHFQGDLFPQKEQVGEMASQIATLLGQSLVQSSRRWSKRKFPLNHYNRGRPSLNAGPSGSKPEVIWKGEDRRYAVKNLVRA